MDKASKEFHNANVEECLRWLSTYVDSDTRSTLLERLVCEEDKLGRDKEQLELTALRRRDYEARISRLLSVMSGLKQLGLMDGEHLSRAEVVLATMRETFRLLEQCHSCIYDELHQLGSSWDWRYSEAEHA